MKMAPTKSTRNSVAKQATTAVTAAIPAIIPPVVRKAVNRRVGAEIQQEQNMDTQARAKRKAENSPMQNDKIKRSALANLTNNVKMLSVDKKPQATQAQQQMKEDNVQKHIALKKKDLSIHIQTQTQVLKETQNINHDNHNHNHNKNIKTSMVKPGKIMTRAALAAHNAVMSDLNESILSTAPVNKQKKEDVAPAAPIAQHAAAPVLKLPTKPTRRISNEFNKTEDSLYMSALENMSSFENSRMSGNFEVGKRRSTILEHNHIKLQQQQSANDIVENNHLKTVNKTPPPGVEDFDQLNWSDQFQVSEYAMDIFDYLKSRESEFVIDDYMKRQTHLSKWMRSLLVDWMVEVQETFELNHETLYLAVKIVDLFLCRVVIPRDKLQLLGAAALFIACKFDERTPPLVEDFLYICDGAYKHNELIKMEMTALRTINYDLGIPLSYRFLRRYARCARTPLKTLTLARYILELSLMDYATVGLSDSRLACAALYIALRMDGTQMPWNLTFEYYTSYKLRDFAFIVPILNVGLHRKPKATVKTIFSKYSHKIFHEVAKVTLMTTEKLLDQDLTAKEIRTLLLEEKNANTTL